MQLLTLTFLVILLAVVKGQEADVGAAPTMDAAPPPPTVDSETPPGAVPPEGAPPPSGGGGGGKGKGGEGLKKLFEVMKRFRAVGKKYCDAATALDILNRSEKCTEKFKKSN